MANTTIDYAKATQDRTISALRQSQEAVVETVGSWAKAVEAAASEFPPVPVVKGVPTLEELVAFTFDFAGEILAVQREFAQKLISAAAPAIKTTPVEIPSA